jgi:hypothetical protein
VSATPFIETYRGHGRRPWRYRIVASNGQTIDASQGYSRRWNRDRAVRHLSRQLGIPVREENP